MSCAWSVSETETVTVSPICTPASSCEPSVMTISPAPGYGTVSPPRCRSMMSVIAGSFGGDEVDGFRRFAAGQLAGRHQRGSAGIRLGAVIARQRFGLRLGQRVGEGDRHVVFLNVVELAVAMFATESWMPKPVSTSAVQLLMPRIIMIMRF